jgi:hypothetical protein
MDSAAPAPVWNRRKRIPVWFIIAATCLGVAMIAIVASKKPGPEPKFAWIDQTQFMRQMRPGRLTQLYYKVVNFTAPVWQRFRRSKTQIQISIKFLAVHGVATTDLGIGTAIGTNDTRTQAWILSASELEELRQRMKTMNGIDSVNNPSITMADGTSASVFVGQSHPQALSFVGASVDVMPKIVSHQFQFGMSAIYSEPNPRAPTSVRTNLAAGCRLILPNAGGILITSPESNDPNDTNYWLILSPTAIDAYGNMTKL